MDYEKKSLRTVKKSLWTRPAGRKEQEGALQYLQGLPFQGENQENEHWVDT
jgi:hypothetical protein